MKLLVNTKDLLGYVVHDNEKDIANLHGTVHTELEDWVDDGLRVFFGTTIFGSEVPGLVALTARTWNDTIRQALAGRAVALAANAGKEFLLDSDFTHGLYLEARAADNKFSAYGTCGILADNGFGWNTFSTVLTDEKLAQVEERPEEWVVLTVQVA